MKLLIVFVGAIVMTAAIDVKFYDMFGGLRRISIPGCRAEPCRIVQGQPLVTYVTFAPESPYYDQGKTFNLFTMGYLDVIIEDGYGTLFGVGLVSDSDLCKYDPSFPLKPKQVSTARIPLLAPRVDPNRGPFSSTGIKTARYLINVGNSTTNFITVVSATIKLNVVH